MAAVEEHALEGIVVKRKSDPYKRGVSWFKIKNRAYSQAGDGRGELLNGDARTVARLREGHANLRVRFGSSRQNPE